MKSKFILLLCFVFALCSEKKPALALSEEWKENFRIFTDSTIFDDIGYGNSDMNTNGEKLVLTLVKANDIVFDVGANVGEWSQNLLNSQPDITIHCFEPIPIICDLLQNNLRGQPVFINQLALSDTKGVATFNYYPTISALSTLHRRAEEIEKRFHLQPIKLEVSLERLDNFCENNSINHINFVKIDTEGNEFSVLRGAERLLNNQAIDFIQFEYGGCYLDSKTTLKQVYSYLSSYGYTIYRITPYGLIKISEWRNELENYNYSNYLAVSSINSIPLSTQDKDECDLIIFSYNRPMQLFAFLESLEKLTKNIRKIAVIIRIDAPYEEDMKLFLRNSHMSILFDSLRHILELISSLY